MSPDYRWSELGPFGLVTVNACSLCGWTGPVAFPRFEIEIVVAGYATRGRRKSLPSRHFRVPVTGAAVPVFLGNGLRDNRLGRHNRRIVSHSLSLRDREIRFSRLNTRQVFAAMDLVHQVFEIEVLTGLGVGQLCYV